MMGRLNQEQERLFYSFCLDEVAPAPPRPRPSGPGEAAGGTVPGGPEVSPPTSKGSEPNFTVLPTIDGSTVQHPSESSQPVPPPIAGGQERILTVSPTTTVRPTAEQPSGTSQPLPVGPPSVAPPPAASVGTAAPGVEGSLVEQILSLMERRPVALAALPLLAVAALLLIGAMLRHWRRDRLRGSVRVLLVMDAGYTKMRVTDTGTPDPAIGLRLITSPPVTKLRLAA